jgi:dihydrofolate reductase
MKKFSIIVATDMYDGIGIDNQLPWSCPNDLKNFKKITTMVERPNKTNAVIMGRHTWESLPKKPLQNRINIIITNNKNYRNENKIYDENVVICYSLNEAFSYCNNIFIEKIFVIGGEKIYNECLYTKLEYIDKIYLTFIQKDYHCNKKIDLSNLFLLLNLHCKTSSLHILEETHYEEYEYFVIQMPDTIPQSLLQCIKPLYKKYKDNIITPMKI